MDAFLRIFRLEIVLREHDANKSDLMGKKNKVKYKLKPLKPSSVCYYVTKS